MWAPGGEHWNLDREQFVPGECAVKGEQDWGLRDCCYTEPGESLPLCLKEQRVGLGCCLSCVLVSAGPHTDSCKPESLCIGPWVWKLFATDLCCRSKSAKGLCYQELSQSERLATSNPAITYVSVFHLSRAIHIPATTVCYNCREIAQEGRTFCWPLNTEMSLATILFV